MKSFSVLACVLLAVLIALACFASPAPPGTDSASISQIQAPDNEFTVSQDAADSIKTPLAEPEVTRALYGKPIGAERHERRTHSEPSLYQSRVSDVPTPPGENKTYYAGFANTRAREKV